MILDIGCGETPRGDVNVDLKNGGDYGSKPTKANLIASAYNLPFRDGAFDGVVFYGLLHHLEQPVRAWREMLRVSHGIISGVEPNFNLIFPRDKTEQHHTFRKREIMKIVRSDSFKVNVDRIISFRHGPCIDFSITAWKAS